jgi:hypothetical protein
MRVRVFLVPREAKMTTYLHLVAAMVLVSATLAFSDPLTIAKDHDHAFDKATWNGGCSPQKALELYEDKAIAIYPGEGEIAYSKAGIEKLVETFLASYCGEGHKSFSLDHDDIRAVALSPDYIVIIRIAAVVASDGTRTQFRATELIHKSGDKWRYVVDHASIGASPETPTTRTPSH